MLCTSTCCIGALAYSGMFMFKKPTHEIQKKKKILCICINEILGKIVIKSVYSCENWFVQCKGERERKREKRFTNERKKLKK